MSKEIKTNLTRNYYTENRIKFYDEGFINALAANAVETTRSQPAGIPEGKEAAVRYIEKGPSGVAEESGVSYESILINPTENNYMAENASEVRFYSLINDNREITISTGEVTLAENLKPGTLSEPSTLENGDYDIVFSDGNKLLYDYKLTLNNSGSYIFVISESGNSYTVTELSGAVPECFAESSFVRFIQTVENAPYMDIYIDGIAVINGIAYNEVSAFIGIPQGVHRITVAAAATSIVYADESFNFTQYSVNNLFITLNGKSGYRLILLTEENACIKV